MTQQRMSDQRRDSRSLTWSICAILVVYFVLVAAHNGLYHALLSSPGPNPTFARVLANASATIIMLILVHVLKVSERQRKWSVVLSLLLAALFSAVARVQILSQFPPFDDQPMESTLADLTLGLLVVMGAGVLGYVYVEGRRSFREETRRAADERLQRELALETLGNEEVRIRRSVAEGLHGGLQQRLVVQVVRIERAIALAQKRGAAADELESLTQLRDDMDVIREQDVRQMSRLLYPEGIEVGVAPAVRMLLRRLPPGIVTRLEVSTQFRSLDDPTSAKISEPERLLLLRVIEESITNALRHGHASSIEVWLATDATTLVAEVLNDGELFSADPRDPSGGVARLKMRVELAGGQLTVGNVSTDRLAARNDRDPGSQMAVVMCVRLPLLV